MAVHDLARIEEKLDRVAVGNTPVSETMGGLTFTTMSEVIEFAKLMSLSGNAVPKHLQANPGMCLAVCVQALEWRMSPFSVANKSYEVQGRLSFESQLLHALIEQRAPITGRLMHKFDGEGDDRRCIVTATLRETGETLEYVSPPFSKIQPKNSPLWKTKPDLQLYYNTSRDFCRAYFPDVLLGVYSQEELRGHVGPDNARDVNDRPSVAQRLKAKGARGFNASHVDRETRGGVVDESSPAKGDAGHSEALHDATRHERDLKDTENRATDAHGQPDRVETVAGIKEGGDDASLAWKSGQAGEMPATDSNSVEPGAPQAQAQPDTPAADLSPPAAAAGVLPQSSAPPPADEEAQASEASPAGLPSDLLPDWQDTYLRAMSRVTDRPKSLTGRHTEALQLIGGKANADEQEWMKAVYRITERRLRGEITKDECDAAIREIS